MVRDFSWLVADLLDSSSGSELAAVLHLLPCCAVSNSFLLCSCLVCFGTIIIRVVSAVASHAQLRSCDYWDMMSVWTKVQCKTANQMASQVPTQASALLLPLDPLIPVVPTEGRSSQPVNKIVILKPNPRGGFDPTEATASTSFHRQSGGIQAPEYSAAECSTFSVKEVRRRFRIVTGETREGRPPMNEDDVQRDPCLLRDSFTIIKDSRQAPPATDKNDARPSNSSKHKQINDSLGGFNSDVSTSKDASTFYAEAKKHLTEILKDNTHTGKYPSPAVQVSRSLVGMLSLPQCSTPSSPGSTPRVRECIEHSQEEKNICAIQKTEGEESR